MPKEKVTITLDRAKAESARSLLGAGSKSEVGDIALDRLIRTERLRHDVAAYRRVPPRGAEAQLALMDSPDLDDATDWEMLYAEEGD